MPIFIREADVAEISPKTAHQQICNWDNFRSAIQGKLRPRTWASVGPCSKALKMHCFLQALFHVSVILMLTPSDNGLCTMDPTSALTFFNFKCILSLYLRPKGWN